MEQDELRKLEDQCIQEQPPGCSAACPVHVDVRAMMAEAARGNFTEAAKIFRRRVPFPGIVSRVCDEPCRSVCRRKDVGDPLAVSAIERSCLDYAEKSLEKTVALPGKTRRIAVLGGGLSGLTAAFDLAGKGYAVTVFEAGPYLGGSLWRFSRQRLPGKIIERDLEILERVGVAVRLNTSVGKDISFDALCADFDAVYVSCGEGASDVPTLDTDAEGRMVVDGTTLATAREGVFAGGALRWGEGKSSPIQSISDGRIAAVSIDRFLQGVSLTASREGEGAAVTRLHTSVEGIEPLAATPMSGLAGGYSREDAAHEASRCLQCQCLECVKVCEYLNSFRAYPKKYIRQIYNNLSIVMGRRHANKLINSCSLCGLCREVCPEDLHMGLVCRKARQTLVEQGKMPPSSHDFPLRDMAFSNSEKCAFARHQPGTAQSGYLFFPGCQLAASAPEHVKSAYKLLVEKLSGGVGFMSRCCGAPADWSGRTELFQSIKGDFLDLWREMGHPQLILACSTCHEIFKTHLSNVPISSLWEVLDSLGLPENGKRASHKKLAIHDACTTRHEGAIHESVRSILRRLGIEIEELALSRDRTECCGYGGLMFFANPELAKNVTRRRGEESPLDYLAYCAMCRDYLAFSGKRALHLLDLIFDAPIDEAALRKGPVYSQRHENRARLKNAMLREFWDETAAEAQGHEMIRLEVSDAVREIMEERLILAEDVQRVIEFAERTGNRLLNRKTGRMLTYCKPTSVTYWVEYSASGDGFAVHNAYSHRMEIAEEAQP